MHHMHLIDLRSKMKEWTKRRFILRSSYYSGRGVTQSDLNSKILEQIYQGLKVDVGQTEATNFVNFVAYLKDLSASAFIQSFEQFWASNFMDSTIEQSVGQGNQLTGHGKEELFVEGMMLLAHALSGRRQNGSSEIQMESFSISHIFLLKHKDELTPANKKSKEPKNGGYMSPNLF